MIATSVQQNLVNASWIRKMFEKGAALKAELGEDQVCDLSLGNPLLEPPAAFAKEVMTLLEQAVPGNHRYPPNSGLIETRAAVAQYLCEETAQAFTANHIVMTCGAAGGLNILFKVLLNPGDEVISPSPYFVEYDFYVENFGGTLVRVPTTDAFQLDIEAISKAITPRTKAVLINSPNNPTGVVYPPESLQALADCLTAHSANRTDPIVLVADEPYRRLNFEQIAIPWPCHYYPYTVLIESFSKDLGLAGERLGYVAIAPELETRASLMDALIFANRVLGFVNAPTLVQRALPKLLREQVDIAHYQQIRDLLFEPLRDIGYHVVKPQGAFYMFPQSPIKDDVAFVEHATQEGLLVVPGSGFALPGYFRISLSTSIEVAKRALPRFERLFKKLKTIAE